MYRKTKRVSIELNGTGFDLSSRGVTVWDVNERDSYSDDRSVKGFGISTRSKGSYGRGSDECSLVCGHT